MTDSDDVIAEPIKVRIVQLCDRIGKIQAIFPENAMLDMAALTRISKRRFEPIAAFNIEGDPLLKPDAHSTYIDQSLLEVRMILIRNNANGSYREVRGADLKSMFSSPLNRFERISIPVVEIEDPVDDQESDEEEMMKALGRFQSIRLKQRLEDTLELPPLPASAQRIIQLCANENAGTDELCKVISLDPSLSAQVVSWAASPYYGAPGEIESVEDAIIRVLGFDMVMNLALGLAMGKALTLPANGPRHYNDYWYSAVLFAALMEAIVQKMPADRRPRLGHAYLCGLLHNFGYLAVSYVLPPHFTILSRYLEANSHLPSHTVEMQLLHLTREQVGAWLLRHWSLPDSICTGIRFSKSSHYRGKHAILATLLNTCHLLAEGKEIDADKVSQIGLESDELYAIFKQVQQASDSLKQMVALIHGKAF